MSLETHELEKIFQASKYQRKELAQLILLSLDGESGAKSGMWNLVNQRCGPRDGE